MPFALLLIEAANPAGSWIVITVLTKDVMNLIDESQCETSVFFITRLAIKIQKVANGKSIGP
jgi:hypothetical protein